MKLYRLAGSASSDLVSLGRERGEGGREGGREGGKEGGRRKS